jgi:agmatine/peptidylarginine deiminase
MFPPMLERSGLVLLLFLAASPAVDAADGSRAAAERRVVDPAFLATIVDDEANPLPRGLTPDERARWSPSAPALLERTPPPGPVRAQAEYEENDGLLIRWGTQNALLTEMTVAVTTLTPDARMYIVVSGASQQASATTTLQGAGANLSRVSFITAPTDSIWIRDYGPRFVDHGGQRAIVDHTYNRPRPNDNAFPSVLANLWNEQRFLMPLNHGGGNFHLFATRRAFMTELIVNENPGLTAAQIRDLYQAYQGLDVGLTAAFPASFDSTQHIDMWTLPVDDDEIIVGSYPSTVGTPATIADAFAAARAADGMTVWRTPGFRSGSTHYTYTNSVIVNNIVMICRFNGFDVQNAQARAVFEQAFEDKTIVQVDCSSIISLAGAIHCIVMHVPRMIEGLLFRNGFEP